MLSDNRNHTQKDDPRGSARQSVCSLRRPGAEYGVPCLGQVVRVEHCWISERRSRRWKAECTVDRGEDQLRRPARSASTIGDDWMYSRKVDGQSDSDVAHNRKPADDPGHKRGNSGPGKGERPVVEAARNGIQRGDLAKGNRHTHVNAAHDEPVPKGKGSSTTSERVD